MKKQLRNFIISMLYVICKFFLPRIYTNNHGKTRVLVFHHLDEKKRFERLIDKISKHYNLISLDDYIKGNVALDRINIIISLDDGYRSWYTVGAPIFRQYNITPVLAINSGFIGIDDELAKVYCKNNIKTWYEEPLSWNELRELVLDGAYVCSHTTSHIDLTSKVISLDEKIGEAIYDKKTLEQQLGIEISGLTYPFGRYDKDSCTVAASGGFEYGFTSNSAFLDKACFPYEIPRTNVGMRHWITAFGYIEGWPEKLTKWAGFFRTNKIKT